MSDIPKRYVVVIPEDFAGEVMGKLSVVGATLESSSRQGKLIAINLTSIESTMDSFEKWLHKITDGHGNVAKTE